MQRLNDRIRTEDWYHDLSEEESNKNIERQLARAEQHYEENRCGAQQRHEESSHCARQLRSEGIHDLVQRFEQFRREQAAEDAEAGRSFTLIHQEFDTTRDIVFEQLRRTVLNHHTPILGIIHKDHEELRSQITQLQRGRETDSAEWAGVARHIRETRPPRQDVSSCPHCGRHERWKYGRYERWD